jgi:hypothetical protein
MYPARIVIPQTSIFHLTCYIGGTALATIYYIVIIANIRYARSTHPAIAVTRLNVIARGIVPRIQAIYSDTKVTKVDAIPIAMNGVVFGLADFNKKALIVHIRDFEQYTEGVSVLVRPEMVVSVRSIGRDSVGSLGDHPKCN